MYLGEINHGDTGYPGEHAALIDRTLFERAQEILARNAAARGYSQSQSQALLVGRLFDDRGHRMTPSFAAKRGVRYRYYVSRAVTEGRNDLAGSIVRVPAVDVERAVLDALHSLASTMDPKGWSSLLGRRPQDANRLNEFSTIALRDAPTQTDPSAIATESSASAVAEASDRIASAPSPAMALASESRRLIEAAVERVDIRDGSVEIALTREATAIVGEAAVVIAWRKSPTRVSRELIQPIEGVHPDARAARSDTKAKLLAGIAKARGWLDDLIAGRVLHIANIAQREKRSVRSTAMLLSLAFLAPALVQAIAENRLPRGIGLTRLSDLPSDWSEQFRALGLQAPR
jgi:hypothetical protein